MELKPDRIVRALMEMPVERLTVVGQLRVLLIEVDDVRGPLVEALRATINLDVLSEPETGVTPTRTLLATTHRRASDERVSSQTPAALRECLNRTPHFVVIPMKRSAFDADHRVTIGRSPKSDIVLHHASVSTNHAWLDDDEEEGVDCIADRGSKNGTRINERLLEPSTSSPVYAGDRVAFGNVRAMFTLVKTLRAAILL